MNHDASFLLSFSVGAHHPTRQETVWCGRAGVMECLRLGQLSIGPSVEFDSITIFSSFEMYLIQFE